MRSQPLASLVALRGQRSLRDVYTGFAVGLPLVGDQRERHPPKEYTGHEVTAAPRAAGPAGRPGSFHRVAVATASAGNEQHVKTPMPLTSTKQ